MYRAVIIYAPQDEAINRVTDLIGKALKQRGFSVTRKEAARASIPDMAAADLLILGAKPEGPRAIHTDFREIIRALKGVNLAGRLAGVYALEHDSTLAALQKALKDSEVFLPEGGMLLAEGKQGEASSLSAWVHGLIKQWEKRSHES